MVLQKFIKWLRSLGWLGSIIANTVQFLCAYKGITVPAAVTIAFTFFHGAVEWVQQPQVWIPATFFLFFLWTTIGVVVLKNINSVKTVRNAHDYAYSFIIDGGFETKLARFSSNHPTSPNAECLVVTCMMRNVGAGPATLCVESLDVRIDNRTSDESPPMQMNFAKLAQKGIRSGGIPRDVTKSQLEGTITCKFIYGPPDQDFVRRLTIKANVYISFVDDKIHTEITLAEDKDEPYFPR